MDAVEPLDENLLAQIQSMLNLRAPNRAAVETLAFELWRHYIQEEQQESFEGVIASATGVGKTYVIVAALEYLAIAYGVRDFVVVAPSRVVLDKTVEQFTVGHERSIVDKLTVPVHLVTAENFRSPSTAAAMNDPETVKVYAFSVQSFMRPESQQGRRTHRFQEGLGAGLYARLQAAAPLVVFADEHHLYYGPRFSAAVRDLEPWALVGLTATPHKKTPKDQIIYRYPLAAAIAEKFVKTPVIVGRKDDKHDLQTKLLDGMVLLDHKRVIADEWARRKKLRRVNPIMLVVARDTDEADSIADIIRSDDFRGGQHRGAVLVVHSNVREADEPEALSRLAAVEDPDSSIRVVVSVAMLKEGWDVKNVYVLLSTQPSVSAILTEQVLGRGLRMPWSTYQGVEMLDTLEVIAHERYEALLQKRGVLQEEFVDYVTRSVLREDAQGRQFVVREREEIIPTIATDSTAVPIDATVTDVTARIGGGTDAGELQPFKPAPTMTSTEERTRVGANSEEWATVALQASRILRIPRVRRIPKPIQFSLSDIHDEEPFQHLGRRLALDPQTELRRVLVGARVYTDPRTGIRSVRTVTSNASDVVHAQGSLMPASELREHLRDTLLGLPIISARADDGSQAKAAERIVTAFMNGLNGNADELLAAYLERAGARLGQIVMDEYRKHAQRPTWDQKVDTIDFSPERVNTRPVNPDPRALPVRGQTFENWKRGLYALAWFDSGTERDFALVVDNSDKVDVWVRLHQGDIPIVWTEGGNRYEPDFVVVDKSGDHWLVEVKSDKDIPTAEVQTKRVEARRWANYANDGLPAGSPKWAYLLVSETDLREAKEDWTALKRLSS